MKIVDIEQGTPEWLEFRRGKIGSSDASVIMGVNPWKTPYQLWKQHLDGTQDAVNQAMRRGSELEPLAREMFIEQTGISVRPKVCVSEEFPWQIASLDGLSEDGSIIVEIKCGNADLHGKALKGEIPPYYFCQLQHQISVCKPKEAYYCSFNGEEIKILKVDPEASFIEDMLHKEEEFLKMIIQKEPPEMSDKDYAVIEHARGSDLLKEYFSICQQEKVLKERKDSIKDELTSLGGQQNFILDGTKIYQAQRISYDFKRMKEEGVRIEEYAKLSNPYWMITTPRSARERA